MLLCAKKAILVAAAFSHVHGRCHDCVPLPFFVKKAPAYAMHCILVYRLSKLARVASCHSSYSILKGILAFLGFFLTWMFLCTASLLQTFAAACTGCVAWTLLLTARITAGGTTVERGSSGFGSSMTFDGNYTMLTRVAALRPVLCLRNPIASVLTAC